MVLLKSLFVVCQSIRLLKQSLTESFLSTKVLTKQKPLLAFTIFSRVFLLLMAGVIDANTRSNFFSHPKAFRSAISQSRVSKDALLRPSACAFSLANSIIFGEISVPITLLVCLANSTEYLPG